MTVTAHAEFTVAGQTAINTAAVTGVEVDVNPADNTASHPVTVGPAADVSIVKSAPARVPAENQMLYTLQVANAGPQTATAVTVTDTLPDGLRLIDASPSQGQCSADGRKVICELGDIHSGAKANVHLTVEVAAGTAGSRLLNTAKVTASEPDPDPADNSSEAATDVDLPVRPAGNLSVTKVADSPVIELGRPAAFTISVHNGTDRPATNVTVLDTPSGVPVAATSMQPQRGACDIKTGRCALGELAAGETVSVRVTMTPEHTGDLVNAVAVSSDQGDRDASDNSASASVKVTAAATQFSLTKRANRRTVKAGGKVMFTIRAKNTGRHAAQDVRVCDTPGSGVTFVKTKGAKLTRGRACWTVKYWPAAKRLTFKVTAKVNRTITGRVGARARLDGTGVKTLQRKASVRVRGAQDPPGGVTG